MPSARTPRRTGRRLRAAAGLALTSALVVGTAAWAVPTRGSIGIGDPYYPNYGNGGYDVENYAIDVDYAPSTDRLTGSAVLRVRALKDLSSFNLDFVLDATSVSVDGTRARMRRGGSHELVVTPREPLARFQTFRVVVTYAGTPSTATDGTISPWIRTADGAVAVGEPEIAAWWFPANDHPRDKATFDVSVTVPAGVEAISNGRKVSQTSAGGKDTWRWRADQPMAPYLAFMAVGQFDVTSGTTGGRYWLNAIASGGGSEGRFAAADLARTGEVLDWEASKWGPYPFTEMGGVAPAADFGFALENQTRPVYTRGFWSGGSNIYVVVHEQAHQWYGDSVSLTAWKDIFLNEGFASFTEWLWSEDHGDGSAQQLLEDYYNGYAASSPFWSVRIGDPGKGNEFNGAVYDRGAMTLQALRNRIGEQDFFTLMRRWADNHELGSGNLTMFMRAAEIVSGEDLDGFFQHWLFDTSKPAATTENGLKGVVAKVGAPTPASRAKIDAVHAAHAAGAQPTGR